MKLFGLIFAVVLVLIRPGNGILVLKHVKCAETLTNLGYHGNRCTVSNITLPETSYNWGRVKYSELHFTNSTIPFFPDRLEQMMKQFVILNMKGVKLEILTQSNMKDATCLRELYLSGNHLTMLANQTFNGSVALKTLDLSFNGISLIEAATFDNLKNLSNLDLSHNRLITVGTEFQDLINLSVLNLSNNQLQAIHPNVVSSLQNINVLNFESNHLMSLVLNVCHEFTLQLILGDNGMEAITINWNPVCRMGQENKLEIVAPDNRIYKVATDKQINLIHVDLQRNGLSSIKGMTNMKHLSTLNLAGNQIISVSFDLLSNLTNLRELNLSHNALRVLNVTNICEKVPTLKWLGLSGNVWKSCKYLSDIVTVLKQAKIEVDLIPGEGDLSCVVIETEESTESDDEETTVKTTTPETLPTHDDNGGTSENGNQIIEFLKSDFLRILIGILLIFAIIAVIVRICIDCKGRGRGVDLGSVSYANGGTIGGTRM